MTDTPKNRFSFWFARIAVFLVFVINVQCALSFLFFPELYIEAYELSGLSGEVALQGIAVAFLMWNATYPLVIIDPEKYRTLYGVVLAQQLIGLVGESAILLSIPEGHIALSASILRFIAFDGAGLILMGLAFIVLFYTKKRTP